jgi:polar amino acid transport system substrate-binding protein
MKKFLTLLLTALLAVTCCFGLTACGDDDSKYITVGYTDYAPMNYTEDGELVGFDTELAKKVFSDLGYKVRFKLIVWENKYVELNNGTIDCIWNGFTSNGEDDGVPRSQSVDFTYNYMQNAQCIIRKSDAPAITSREDFIGKSIAFESNSSGESLAKAYRDAEEGTADDIAIMLSGRSSQMEAVSDVLNGTADYAIVDILLANATLTQSTYSSLVVNEGLEIGVEYYAVGFKKGSSITAKVNSQLEKLAENGYLMTLATKYNLATSVITNFESQK